MPELEPAQEPREGHVTDSEEPDKGNVTARAAEALRAALLVVPVLRVGVMHVEAERSKREFCKRANTTATPQFCGHLSPKRGKDPNVCTP